MAPNTSHHESAPPSSVPLLDGFALACLGLAALFVAATVLEALRLRDADSVGFPGLVGVFVLMGALVGVFALLALHALHRAREAVLRATAQQAALLREFQLHALRAHTPDDPPALPATRAVEGGAFNGHPFAGGFPFGFTVERPAAIGPAVDPSIRRESSGTDLDRAHACLVQTELALRGRERSKQSAALPAQAPQAVELV